MAFLLLDWADAQRARDYCESDAVAVALGAAGAQVEEVHYLEEQDM